MNRHWRLFAVIVALAVAFRVIFWLEALGREAPLRGDEISYDAIARSLASGNGFAVEPGVPTASRPPLYPVVLGGLYRVAGAHETAGRILQIVLGAAIVLLTYALARRFFSGETALVASGLAAFNPSLVFVSVYLLAENLYLVLLLAFLVLFSSAHEKEIPYRSCVGGGMLLALACLTRPNAFPFALYAAAAFLVFGAGRPCRRIARTAVMLGVCVLALVPWTARNEAVFGKFVPFTSHGGITFYQGNNRVVAEVGAYHGTVAPLEALPGWEGIKAKGEIGGDEEAWRLGKEFVTTHSELAAKMAGWRLARFWRLTGDAGFSGVKSGWWWDKGRGLGSLASSIDVVFIFSIVVMPLFVLGLALTLRRARALVYLYGIVFVHTAAALVFFGSLRARMPLEPVIAVLAAFGAVRLFQTIRPHFVH